MISLSRDLLLGLDYDEVTRLRMDPDRDQAPPASTTKEQQPAALDHVQGAHRLLQSLEERIGEHPELRDAITRLEMALSILTVQTGGML